MIALQIKKIISRLLHLIRTVQLSLLSTSITRRSELGLPPLDSRVDWQVGILWRNQYLGLLEEERRLAYKWATLD